jgi:hypothetical protein
MRNLGRMCGNRQVKGEGRKKMIGLFKETNIIGLKKNFFFKLSYILHSANFEVYELFSCYQSDVIFSCTKCYTSSQCKIFLPCNLIIQ